VYLCPCALAHGNESAAPEEVDFCNVQFPPNLSVVASQPTPLVYGRVYELGTTEAPGPAPGVIAQLGYGPLTSNPEWEPGWSWFPGVFNVQVVNDDEYQATFIAPAAPGVYATAIVSPSTARTGRTATTNGAGSNANLLVRNDTAPDADRYALSDRR